MQSLALRRTFGDDLAACLRCGGRMRLGVVVQDQQSIDVSNRFKLADETADVSPALETT
jgi:hypothetical protein